MSCDFDPDGISPVKEFRFCPFRKRTIYKARNSRISYFSTRMEDAELSEEDFLPCLKERCAVWNKHYEQCGLTNKFN